MDDMDDATNVHVFESDEAANTFIQKYEIDTVTKFVSQKSRNLGITGIIDFMLFRGLPF